MTEIAEMRAGERQQSAGASAGVTYSTVGERGSLAGKGREVGRERARPASLRSAKADLAADPRAPQRHVFIGRACRERGSLQRTAP